jgi:catechol 2,3-dioxygenase
MTTETEAATSRLGLSHLGLRVRDLPRMQAFYVDVLGLRVSDEGLSRRRGCTMVFLTGDASVHHHLVLVESDGEVGGGRLEHLAFAVGSLAGLREVRDRARAVGIQVDAVDHGNAWSLYLYDPEGNRIEAFTPAPFAMPQPYGRPFDLDVPDADIVAATRVTCTGGGG